MVRTFHHTRNKDGGGKFKVIRSKERELSEDEKRIMQLNLAFTVRQCKDLIVADTVRSDPYVVVTRQSEGYPAEQSKTLIKWFTLNPKFMETFYFTVHDWEKDTMYVEVMDKDLLRKDDSMGHCVVTLDTLRENQSSRRTYELQGVKKGKIQIELLRFGPEALAGHLKKIEQSKKDKQ